MYFNFLPSIKYDVKPISYPFSESDFVVAKNFFRRYKITDTAFNSTVFYKKYAIGDDIRLDQISEAAYGNPKYDWVVALVNNMINPLYDLPMTENDLRNHVESRYKNPYYDIHHYEIISDAEQKERYGKVLIPGGTWVDETFYNSEIRLENDTFPNLTPDTETIRVQSPFVFDARFPFKYIDEGLNYEIRDTNLDGLEFPTILGDDGFRSSTQLALYENNTYGGSYVILNPIDLTYYNKIEIRYGMIKSPQPGDYFYLGYKNLEGEFDELFEIENWISANGNYVKEFDLPESIRTTDVQLVFYTVRDETQTSELFAVSDFNLIGEYVNTIPLEFEYNQINDDNYIIDGVEWVRENGSWYRKVQTGYQYWDGSSVKEIPADELTRPVTEFEYESEENEKKREIYLLKPKYLQALVDDFRKASLYKKSSDYVSNKLKGTGV
jgi:hypothetical protein